MENDFIENLIAERQKEKETEKAVVTKAEQAIPQIVETEQKVEIEETADEPKDKVDNVPIVQQEKSLQEVSISNLKVKLDETKSFEEQAESIASAMTVASAVQDEETRKTLVGAKSEELKIKAKAKLTEQQAEATEAVTKKQKSEREKFATILETFGIYRHLPRGFLISLLIILVPLYWLYTLFIGAPTGAIKFTVDCLDGIFIRYDEVDDKRKPKVKVFAFILLGLAIILIACLTVLSVTHII